MNRTPPTRIPPTVPNFDDIPPVSDDVAQRLRALHARAPIPAHVQDAILTHARRIAARRAFQRRILLAAPLAAAAGLALAVWVAWPSNTSRLGVQHPPAFASGLESGEFEKGGRTAGALPHAVVPGDLNRDGSVDMRDALALAQRVQRSVVQPGDDQNADGVVDSRDVDVVAMLAVSIRTGKGGGA